MKKLHVLFLIFGTLSCGSSSKEENADDDGFDPGQSSTVVTGANLTEVSASCLYSNEGTSNLQSVNCKLLLGSDTTSSELALVYDETNLVTAVEGVDIAWGIPPDLNFVCQRVRQSAELFCFRESEEELTDFNILLVVASLDEPENSIRIYTTAVSSDVDQSAPPDAPSDLAATTMSSNQINLSFTDHSDSETGFTIQRSTDSTNWLTITTTASQVTSYSNTGLAASTTYYYRVNACNLAGCSSYSDAANATTNSSGGSPHIVFISSGVFAGDNSGLVGADSVCQNLANTALLTGNWKAILSTSSVHAKDRITISAAVYNTNGEKVADDSTDFWDLSLDTQVRYSENVIPLNSALVWTGSMANGENDINYNQCLNWTSSNGSDFAAVGDVDASNNGWIAHYYSGCDNLNHLFCINGQ